MKKYIFALIASVMATMVSAQTISIQEEREFYQKVYHLFTLYAQSASVSDDEEETMFRNLFVNGELEIQNDLMNLSREQKLTVEEYIQTIQKARSVKVLVKNIKKDGDVEDAGETWNLPVVFEKGITFSKDGAFFDSYDYFAGYYRLRAVVSLNKSSGECYITELGADPKHEWLVFPEKFTVLERTPQDENKRNFKRDEKLTIEGRDVHWNRYNQVMLRPGQEQKIRYNDNAVEIKEMSKMSNGGSKIRAYYSDKSFRIRGSFGMSLGGFNKLDNAPSSITTPKDDEMSFGADLGYVFPSTSKFYVGIFAGVHMSNNNLTMEKGTETGIKVHCDNNGHKRDEDDNTYDRMYDINGGVTQELKASDLAIPIYFDFEYQLMPKLSLYFDLGVKLQMTSDKWTASINNYETWGTGWNDPDYGDVQIRGDVDVNGFGSWSGERTVLKEGVKSSMSINGLIGLGLRYNLGKSPVAIEVGGQFMTGSNSWKVDSKKPIFDYILPQGDNLSKEDKAKGDMVNLLRDTGGIKHSAIRLTAGIIYKF